MIFSYTGEIKASVNLSDANGDHSKCGVWISFNTIFLKENTIQAIKLLN